MSKKRVVVVDDEIDLCHLIKSYLAELNYEVYAAYTLSSGLKLIHEVKPDVVFLDNNLPDGLGWDKMNYLNENFPGLKINLISAFQNVGDVPLENKAISVIEKPLTLNSIRQYL